MFPLYEQKYTCINLLPPAYVVNRKVMFSVMSVCHFQSCLSVILFIRGSLCDHYPWCHWSVTRELPYHMDTWKPPVQNCSLETYSPFHLLSSGQLTFDWKAFLFCTNFLSSVHLHFLHQNNLNHRMQVIKRANQGILPGYETKSRSHHES